MKESAYIQQVCVMIQAFNVANTERKTQEEAAQKRYRDERSAADIELKHQQDIFATAKNAATSQHSKGSKNSEAVYQKLCHEAARHAVVVQTAQQQAIEALTRVQISSAKQQKTSFQPPALAQIDPLTQLQNCEPIATELVRQIRDDVTALIRLREDIALKRQRRRRRQKILLTWATILLLIISSAVALAWLLKPHHLLVLEAVKMRDWNRMQEEYQKIVTLYENSRDIKLVLCELYYQSALWNLVNNTQQQQAVDDISRLVALNRNYKVQEIQHLLKNYELEFDPYQKPSKPGTSPGIQATNFAQSEQRYIQHCPNVYMREQPTAEAPQIELISCGTAIEVLGYAPSLKDPQYKWYHVRNSKKIEGWMYAGEKDTWLKTSPLKAMVATQTDPLSIRKGKGEQYEVLTRAAKGEELVILDGSDAWLQVRLKNGIVGYADSKYIKVLY